MESKGLETYIRLFNQRQFFEAHEVLEDEWHKTGRGDNFYKGLIQLAAALVHVQKGNAKGAKRLVGTARRYLEPYGACHQGLNLGKLFAEVSSLVRRVATSSESGSLRYPVLELRPG